MNLSQVTESVLAHALEAVSEGSLISDADRNIIYSNAAFTEITGYEQSDIMGSSSVRFLQGANTSPEELQRMRTTLDAAEVYRGTILNYRKDGTPFWNNLTIAPLKDDSGKVTNFVSVQRDVTDIVVERQKLSHEATHDQLTGLPNREALRRHLRSEFSDAAEDGSVVALGMIDLDDFKLVNDEHGHLSGDAVLIQFAARVSELLRRGDYVARLGGDEFVVVISDLSPGDPTAEVVRMLERIHDAVRTPFELVTGALCSVGMSMGISLFPTDGVTDRDLLRSADAALYRAKRLKGSGSWWEIARPQDATSTDGAAEAMGSATTKGELVMFMQPIVDLKSGLVTQVEALARIRRANGDIDSPDNFLPYYTREQLEGLFKEGLDQALSWASRWENDGVELSVSVNIPPELLNAPASADWVRDALARHSLQAHRLSLELLESQELDLAASDQTVAELVRLGVKIHLDDLSSGFSTLKRITDIPFDVIKIDRQIFDRAHSRPVQVLTVLAAITKLGSDLGYGICVEGIEDRERLEVSSVLGAGLGQGSLFARPMPPEDVAHWVAQFTMPHHNDVLATPLGALAYHLTHTGGNGLGYPSRDTCPLTEFFSGAPPEIAEAHESLHSRDGASNSAVVAVTSWLVDQIQRGE